MGAVGVARAQRRAALGVGGRAQGRACPPHRCPPRLKRPPPLLDPIRRLSCRRAATFSRSGIAERLSRRATIAAAGDASSAFAHRSLSLARCFDSPRGRTIRSTPVSGLRKCPWRFGPIFIKASMVGFTLLSRSYYYLRRRSPGPPFPPDHRQAQGNGGLQRKFTYERAL